MIIDDPLRAECGTVNFIEVGSKMATAGTREGDRGTNAYGTEFWSVMMENSSASASGQLFAPNTTGRRVERWKKVSQERTWLPPKNKLRWLVET